MPSTWQKVLSIHHQFVSRCCSDLYRDIFAEILLGQGSIENPQVKAGGGGQTVLKRQMSAVSKNQREGGKGMAKKTHNNIHHYVTSSDLYDFSVSLSS